MSNGSNNRIQLYLDDAREQLDGVESHLLLLEQGMEAPDPEILNEIFRGIHTIKGGADFLGLNKIRSLSHAAEDVLDLVRSDKLTLNRDDLGLLLVVTDTLKEMLSNHEHSESIDITKLIEEISLLSAREGSTSEDSVREESAQESLASVEVDHKPTEETDLTVNEIVGDSEGLLKLGLSFAPGLFEVDETDLDEWRENAFNLYILEYEIDDDSSELMEVFAQLDEIGYMLAYKGPVSLTRDASDSEEVSRYFVLFRTVLSKTLTVRYLRLDPGKLYSLREGEAERTHSLDVLAFHADVKASKAESETLAMDSEYKGLPSLKAQSDVEESFHKESSSHEKSEFQDQPNHETGRTIMPDSRDSNIDVVEEQSTEVASTDDSRAKSTIRVNVDLLDNLMNLAGELVLTRNQLNQNVEHQDINAINLAAQRLDTVTSELQEAIMSTRMQPISIVLSRFQRMTRDTSQKLGKMVNLALEGEEVELDKSIIENIGDPLTHLVRNAIDHGIESPTERRAAGKSDAGTVSIKARHEAGHVVIDVSDDGKGIDPARIKERAIEKGIIDRSKGDDITEKELLRMIFLPGFSTAEQLSDISGRGVGMDVVFTNLSRLGGTIDVDTHVGKGTQFRIKLPLTLAIVPSLLVSVQEEIFAIPQVNLVELVRLPPGQEEKIEFLGDTAVMRLRGKLLPVVWLSEFLGVEPPKLNEKDEDGVVVPFREPASASKSYSINDSTNVVVVAAGDFHYGIVVDNLTDSEEIVVKPLGTHLRNCQGYAGATILGDGRAALILDVAGISEAGALRDNSDLDADTEDLLSAAQENLGDDQKLLVVENATDQYFGVQLAYVNRIERILSSSVQIVGNKQVVKYRGGVLRVFSLEDGLETETRTQSSYAYLVIFHMMGVEVAIVVSNIIDIIDSQSEIDNQTFRQKGVVGSTIVMDRITLLLDLFALVASIDPDMAATDYEQEEFASTRSVLIVEDSMFFQDKLEELLQEMDINVIIAEDGQVGWEILDERGSEVDLVLMDVEMPRMSGIELTTKLRGDGRFQDLPIVMLTSLAKESDIEKGRQAGASDYLVKMDQEMVKQTILKYFRTPRKVA